VDSPTEKDPAKVANTSPEAETPAGTPPMAKPVPPKTALAAPAARPVAKPVGSLVESAPDPPVNKMRRRIIWSAITGSLVVYFLMFVRFFLPRSITEPPTTFRIGPPGDYALGVDTKWQQQYRIWVTKTSDRLFVIYARCTHLGCTPDWKASENKFKCPCHGSGYDSEGINFEGPAPRPMDRAHVEIDAEGQIVVNTAKLYDWEKGLKSEFDELPGAYIPL